MQLDPCFIKKSITNFGNIRFEKAVNKRGVGRWKKEQQKAVNYFLHQHCFQI